MEALTGWIKGEVVKRHLHTGAKYHNIFREGCRVSGMLVICWCFFCSIFLFITRIGRPNSGVHVGYNMQDLETRFGKADCVSELGWNYAIVIYA